jgi:hypothetical protein
VDRLVIEMSVMPRSLQSADTRLCVMVRCWFKPVRAGEKVGHGSAPLWC